MRWIVSSLVLLNIGIFVYYQLIAENGAVDSSASVSALSAQPAGVATVTLLSEKPSVPISSVKVTPSVASKPESSSGSRQISTPSLPAVAVQQPLCTLVGAFEKLLKAEYFVERLQSLGLQASVKNVVVDSDPGYWLHLPPEKSRKDALRRLSELQRRGIDSYVIPSGNLANGISLGMFSGRAGAESMQQRIQQQGYKPEIVEVPREQKEIWVFLPEGEAAKLSDERWAELLSSEEYLQKRQNVCSDVASY